MIIGQMLAFGLIFFLFLGQEEFKDSKGVITLFPPF
jgi:hypothetical protein